MTLEATTRGGTKPPRGELPSSPGGDLPRVTWLVSTGPTGTQVSQPQPPMYSFPRFFSSGAAEGVNLWVEPATAADTWMRSMNPER